jgi:thiamine-monophosphate kinase
VVRASELFISVSAVGTLAGEAGSGGEDGLQALLRSTARPGDVIAVTGELGSAAGGLKSLEQGTTNGRERLIERLHRPTPRIAAGAALLAAGVRCAIDISDGLISDLGHICEASGVSAVVRLADTPVSPLLKELFPDEWAGLALSGGEDYELLFTAPAELIDGVREAVEVPVTVIGEISRGAGVSGVSVLDEDGRKLPIAASGWDHLRQ